MPSGWTRWLMEQFEFPFEVVYPQALDAGSLRAKYDALIFVDGAIPESDAAPRSRFGAQPEPEDVPAEFRDRLGRVTVARTVPQLKAFLEEGGTVLAIGSSTILAKHLGVALTSALTETTQDGTVRPLPEEKYYIPGSLLRVSVDNKHPLAHGMPAEADVFFDNSPAFRLDPDAPQRGVQSIAWFDSPRPLRSGWAWGQHYLHGSVAVATVRVGKGQLILYGPEILFRGQPHGTFKLFFNGLYLAGAGRSDQATTEASVSR
jgi:hypothetical protein